MWLFILINSPSYVSMYTTISCLWELFALICLHLSPLYSDPSHCHHPKENHTKLSVLGKQGSTLGLGHQTLGDWGIKDTGPWDGQSTEADCWAFPQCWAEWANPRLWRKKSDSCSPPLRMFQRTSSFFHLGLLGRYWCCDKLQRLS